MTKLDQLYKDLDTAREKEDVEEILRIARAIAEVRKETNNLIKQNETKI